MKHQEVEEYLDIVDEDDNVIKSLPRSEVYKKELFKQMRSVWLILKNKDGQLWIPRRTLERDVLPGYLDGSVVGHVSAGESYEQALLRETQEEVGINLKDYDYRFFGKVTPKQDKAFCFGAVYELTVERAPRNWDRQEYVDWQWLYPEQVLKKFEQGISMKETLVVILKKFYL